jgi:hypothetical protein
MGGLGRPVAPVVGPPTHPVMRVMQNLVVLWKMSPLRRGVRARRVPGCGRGRGAPPAGAGSQLGPPKPKPGGLVGPRARYGGRRGASPGLLIKPHNIKG